MTEELVRTEQYWMKTGISLSMKTILMVSLRRLANPRSCPPEASNLPYLVYYYYSIYRESVNVPDPAFSLIVSIYGTPMVIPDKMELEEDQMVR